MSQKKKLFIIGIIVIIVAAGAVFLFTRSGNQNSPVASINKMPINNELKTSPFVIEPSTFSEDLKGMTQEVDHQIKDVEKKIDSKKAPAMEFTYELMTDLPELEITAVNVPKYSLVDIDYANKIAKRFGFNEEDANPKNDNYLYLKDSFDLNGSYILQINRKSGYLNYSSIYVPASSKKIESSEEAVVVASAFLKQFGLYGNDLDKPATYQETVNPNLYYVEWHRKWDPLPIVEMTGMLTASIEDRTLNLAEDETIINTSDDTDGISRASDFNTITVVVDDKARVLAANVNVRGIEKTLENVPILSPEEAWSELQIGNGILGFTFPSSANITNKDWDDIFPNGIAKSDEARVREVILAYVEKPANTRQSYLQPVYVFKGEAVLESDALTDFVIAVKALEDESIPSK